MGRQRLIPMLALALAALLGLDRRGERPRCHLEALRPLVRFRGQLLMCRRKTAADTVSVSAALLSGSSPLVQGLPGQAAQGAEVIVLRVQPPAAGAFDLRPRAGLVVGDAGRRPVAL